MQLFRHIMTGALVLLLVVPEVEGNWFQDLFNGFKDGVKNIAKRIGDGVKTVTKGIGKGVKKVVTGIQDVAKKVGVAVKGAAKGIARKGCKVLYGVGCPVGVKIISALVEKVNKDLGTIVDAAGKHTCHVRKNKCKRSADDTLQSLVLYPFSDDFTYYDINGDKEIEYGEFVLAVTKEFPMADPEELREPFVWADANGDNRLDMDEFKGAPFMFAHYLPEADATTKAGSVHV